MIVARAAVVVDCCVLFFYRSGPAAVFDPALDDGFARRGGRPDVFDVAPIVPVAIGPDLDACRDEIRPLLPLYVGAYGAKGGNYYHDLVARFGFEAAADAIQDAYLEGRRTDAEAAVPDEMIDALALVGPEERVSDRMAVYADAGVTTLLGKTREIATIEALARAAERIA
jgi:alkanesulfonate monooxygenase SsuD/methylene tetrahydromethanopterin reductase-like flavin-dependent oxidoreductase (luciferase family)